MDLVVGMYAGESQGVGTCREMQEHFLSARRSQA